MSTSSWLILTSICGTEGFFAYPAEWRRKADIGQCGIRIMIQLCSLLEDKSKSQPTFLRLEVIRKIPHQ